MPTLTVSSVTASPVVFTSEVGGVAACADVASIMDAASVMSFLRSPVPLPNDRPLAVESVVPMVIPRSVGMPVPHFNKRSTAPTTHILLRH